METLNLHRFRHFYFWSSTAPVLRLSCKTHCFCNSIWTGVQEEAKPQTQAAAAPAAKGPSTDSQYSSGFPQEDGARTRARVRLCVRRGSSSKEHDEKCEGNGGKSRKERQAKEWFEPLDSAHRFFPISQHPDMGFGKTRRHFDDGCSAVHLTNLSGLWTLRSGEPSQTGRVPVSALRL